MTEFLTAPNPIRSVLIANRGEIACRIIRTCRRLGLRAVAVYSDADADALHLAMADEAHRIGPAPAGESYLKIEAILEAARAGGVDAIHPGYGFLSENPGFVRAVETAGLAFVGPDSRAVETMGSKIAARRVAREAGVPVVPGFDGIDASDEELAMAAAEIGYPVLVKASAGGGGRGMRQAACPEDLPQALAAARSEAATSFGDATVFLEKLIQEPRHLEVQIFGDGAGGVLHFYERDCSVQRNHQKVIEEAPAPNLPVSVRDALFDHATKLAAAIGYAGAGTVEFVMQAGDDSPYFLEMNTRLQVEHPVTEAICGVDLVEWQLRQAAGLPLPLSQDQIRPKGHAIEVRINAERPETGFLPATGRVETFETPPGLRLDTGVANGTEVSSHYDSMLAKLIAHGPDRAAALDRLAKGVAGTVLDGVGSNLGFLADCLAAPAFRKGEATTGFLATNFPDGWQPDHDRLLRLRGHAAMALLTGTTQGADRNDGFRVGGRRMPGRAPVHVEDDYGTAEIVVHFGADPAVSDGARTIALGAPPAGMSLRDGAAHAADGGMSIALTVRPLAEARMATPSKSTAEGAIQAPLTGLITEVLVAEGDVVAKGQPLLVMEAMKLVHTLTAPHDGRIARLSASPGASVAAKTLLVEVEETD